MAVNAVAPSAGVTTAQEVPHNVGARGVRVAVVRARPALVDVCEEGQPGMPFLTNSKQQLIFGICWILLLQKAKWNARRP